jgi:hypothetical protein
VCFELLLEAETRRLGRVPRSAVLGHAEALLAVMRHLITNESCGLIACAWEPPPGPSFMRFAETTIREKE